MLSELCVRRPVFATMLVASLVVLGIFSFRDLGVDLFPKADPATVSVRLQLPGASPDEMTTAVVMPMENALSGIAGIDQLTANVSAGGSANITVRFVLERDLDDAANNVREKVAGAMRNVPPEVLPPIIQKADPDAEPNHEHPCSPSKTMTMRALTGDRRQTGEAPDRVGGRRRRREHERAAAPRDPCRRGHREAERRGLSIDQVRDAIQKEKRRDPGGDARAGRLGRSACGRLGRIDATSQFDNIIVATVGQRARLRIADIGHTEDSGPENQQRIVPRRLARQAVQLDIRARRARTRSRSPRRSRRGCSRSAGRSRPASR
jgi:HAE1 family hydrophobic/amphiphilic exporter-1